MDWSRVPLPAAAVVLLLAGAWRVNQGGGEGWPLLVLASVLMGAALYQIAHDHKDKDE